MKPDTDLHGTCLCRSVQVTAKVKSHNIGVCHCAMCRKWGGGPLFAAECDNDVTFEGKEHISTFNSSEWAERGFCRKCGTHLFYRLKEGGLHAVPIGLFDNTAEWQLTDQIFIDQKPAFYAFSQKTKNLTGEEVFAQHSGE